MSPASEATNVVLVHDGFIDGSGWLRVYIGLKRQGYQVTIVQNPTISLGGDVARSSDAVRSTVTEGVRAQLGILERVAKGRSKAARREQANTALSGMVGAMVVARLVNDSALSNESSPSPRRRSVVTQTTSRKDCNMTIELSAHAPTNFIEANGVTYAYRRLGQPNGVPLVFLQHFTGTMDSWDPVVVDGFAQARPVILFDNQGVSRSSGTTPDTVAAMANDAVAFITALGLTQVDLLGFSLGGFIAQVIAAEHPALVRRLILAGTGPEGGEGIRNLPQALEQAQKTSPDDLRRYLFFEQTDTSQDAGRAFLKRQAQRTVDRDPESSQQTVGAQFTAIVAWGTDGDPRSARRLQQITQPVLVVNGKNDIMVPTTNSYTLFQRLPNARLSLYPDSGHGGLFQYGETFVDEGIRFLHE
jgi:pimeloyl-ACP methyl ester carboxylesterase